MSLYIFALPLPLYLLWVAWHRSLSSYSLFSKLTPGLHILEIEKVSTLYLSLSPSFSFSPSLSIYLWKLSKSPKFVSEMFPCPNSHSLSPSLESRIILPPQLAILVMNVDAIFVLSPRICQMKRIAGLPLKHKFWTLLILQRWKFTYCT